MKNTPKQIGKRIATLRQERGLSQRQLANNFVSAAYVSRIENGTREASLKVLRHFATKLGTTVEYLETGVKAVTTLKLDEYAPFLTEAGCDAEKLDADEIERLGKFTHDAISRSKTENPLRIAARMLAEQSRLRQDPNDLLYERARK